MGSGFSDCSKTLQSSERSLLLVGGRTKFAFLSRLCRSEAIGHKGAVRLGLGELCRDHHLLPHSSLASSFRLPCPKDLTAPLTWLTSCVRQPTNASRERMIAI